MRSARESSNSIFSYLKTQVPTESKLTVRPTEVETETGAVVHAINGSGFPMLLIPIPDDSGVNLDWNNKSITVRYRRLNTRGAESLFLAIECLSPRLVTQFGLLADDILTSLDESKGNSALVATQVIDRWREMLKDTKGPLLGESQLAGLYGELIFLEQLTLHKGPAALTSWTGPQGNRHDFEFFDASVEVKTTTNHNNLVVAFHGLRQLEARDSLPLFVVAHQIERIPNGESVPQILQRLFDAGMNRLQLLQKLSLIGYDEADSGAYSGHEFSVLKSRNYDVGPEFPRITHETLFPSKYAEKITSIQYTVDLGNLPECLLNVDELTISKE